MKVPQEKGETEEYEQGEKTMRITKTGERRYKIRQKESKSALPWILIALVILINLAVHFGYI